MPEPFSYSGLINGGWRALEFAPFRDGVEIHRLYAEGDDGPAAALLRYAPGAQVPRHLHPGYEHVIVLEGSQRDANGLHQTGDVVVNTPGSSHDVTSEEGCVVLVIWGRPVRFEEAEA